MSENLRNIVLAAAIASMAGCASSRAALPRQDARELEELITAAMRGNGIVGMSAVAVAGGRTLLAAGYGLADRAHGVRVGTDSVFPLGSITKLFTATAVMQLVEQGRVDLDAPISRYLPALPASGPTVRQLLTHHGGITGNYMEGFQLRKPDPGAFRALPRLLAPVAPASAPDTVFAYSNAGYGILGCLVEEASGMAFTDFVARGIIAPLGMSSTLFLATPPDIGRCVKGYDGRREQSAYPIRDLPAGALMSTAADMERFMRFVIDGGGQGVLGRPAFAEMTQRQNAGVALDGDFPIGLGYWLIRPFAAPEAFASHAGDLPPFHAVLVTIPQQKIGLFLAANSSGASSALVPLAVEIVRKLYGWQTGCPVADPPLPERVRPSPAQLAAVAGQYASPMGLIEVRTRGGRILTSLQGVPVELVPRAGGILTPEVSLLGVASIRLPQLASVRLSFLEHGGSGYLRITALGVLAGIGERFLPDEPPEAWKARVGRYAILPQGENIDYAWPRKVSLRYEAGHGMLLDYEFPGTRASFPLATPDDAHAVIRGKGTGLGETITARTDGGDVFLEWSGLLLERE